MFLDNLHHKMKKCQCCQKPITKGRIDKVYCNTLCQRKHYIELGKHRANQKRYADKNRDYYRQKNKDNTKNRYHHLKQKEYTKRNPDKIKAHNFANNNHLKGERCLLCGETKQLHFHHTDYEFNMGCTLCMKHHNEIHQK